MDDDEREALLKELEALEAKVDRMQAQMAGVRDRMGRIGRQATVLELSFLARQAAMQARLDGIEDLPEPGSA